MRIASRNSRRAASAGPAASGRCRACSVRRRIPGRRNSATEHRGGVFGRSVCHTPRRGHGASGMAASGSAVRNAASAPGSRRCFSAARGRRRPRRCPARVRSARDTHRPRRRRRPPGAVPYQFNRGWQSGAAPRPASASAPRARRPLLHQRDPGCWRVGARRIDGRAFQRGDGSVDVAPRLQRDAELQVRGGQRGSDFTAAGDRRPPRRYRPVDA